METIPPGSSRSLQYYVVARRWLSDLEFFRMDINFLRELLNRQINQLQDREHLLKLNIAKQGLDNILSLVTDDLLSGQLTQLELMIEDIIPEDAEALACNQIRLELFINELLHKFRALKNEIYPLLLKTGHNDRLFAN